MGAFHFFLPSIEHVLAEPLQIYYIVLPAEVQQEKADFSKKTKESQQVVSKIIRQSLRM
jgi:hypothetical protein